MFILMKTTMPASPNGYDTKLFEEGEVYEVSEDLGETMVLNDWADETEPDDETKKIIDDPTGSNVSKGGSGADENKDSGSADENKTPSTVEMKADRKLIIHGKEVTWKKGKRYRILKDIPEDVVMTMIKEGAAVPVAGNENWMSTAMSWIKG